MKISDRLMQVKPSATLAVNAKALELKAQGREIISLSVGEPDVPPSAHIGAAAKQAIDDNFTRYTAVPGIPELREAVAGYFNRFYGVDAAVENTIVTNGGKQALYNLFQVLLNPGDEVLIPTPYWVSYPAMVQLAGGVPVTVAASAEADFKISVKDLKQALTPRTRVLLMNSPSNPTGACYTREEMDEIAAWAIENGLFIISDEIYDQLVYAPASPAGLAPWWQSNPGQVCVVNGLAKSFSMTGWRVGYVLGHPDLVKALGKIQGQSTSNVCSIAQKAALAALTGPFDALDTLRTEYARRRDIALDIMSGWKDVVCPKPDGAFYLFPDVHRLYNDTIPDSATLCTRLMEDAGVALVPGVAFGDDRCVRISYAVSEETLRDALGKISKVLFP
ncbi:pyridoxal phosphate-dependent aminotransferase [Oleidesulfovibrio sp.]|uniref:pyridoxal phosphate-dependent aminotransferase n=1 Tax=Oleidesulfovibrio sp. TaxID=2909707 RepID=UPI003A8A436B